MSEFTIRSESVDVEQIMKQIRQRILEKRGQDYTEDQIRELASVRLEKFLEPKNLRSDLLEQFRKSRPALEPVPDEPPPPVITPPYTFNDQTLFTSHRPLMRLIRRLMRPVLTMMFHPATLNHILHKQSEFNVDIMKRTSRQNIEQRQILRQMEYTMARSRNEWNALYYEVLHNIVLETTRLGIEVQNLRMKVESLSSRLDFSERRVRALEGVVQYRPEVMRGDHRDDRDEEQGAQSAPGAQAAPGGIEGFVPGSGEGAGRRRRRRRRGRRGQGPLSGQGGQGAQGAQGAQGTQGAQGQFDEFEDSDGDEGGEDFETTDAGAEAQEELEGRDTLGADASESLEVREVNQSLPEPEASQAPEASEASASAQDSADELRRDQPDPGDDDVQ